MLTDIENKLLRLALDKGAYSGEADSAAIMFIRKLRERGASADELINKLDSSKSIQDIPKYKLRAMPFGKYKGELLMYIPEDYLEWVLDNCYDITDGLRCAIEKVVYGDVEY